MTEPGNGQSEGDEFTQSDPAGAAPFDPYRFGKPDHPIPSEYAPPGYTGPTLPPPTPYGAAPSEPGPAGPFTTPPYPQGQHPYQYPAQPPQNPYQYPSSGYGGGPMPPPFHGYQQPKTGNGKATAALVLGILSIVLCWLIFFDAIFIILALIFGLIGLSESRSGRAGGRGMAIAGLICAAVGTVLTALLTVLIIHAADKCGGFGNSNSSNFQQCVRDHL